MAVLDRAGVRPIGRREEEKPEQRLDPTAYAAEKPAVIEAGLRLIVEGAKRGAASCNRAASQPDGRDPSDLYA
jgi:hypothetical protein